MNSPGFSKQFENLKQTADDAARAKEEAVKAVANEYKGLKISPEISLFLTNTGKELQTQIIESQKQQNNSAQSVADKQAQVQATFEKGKAFYANKDYAKAVDQWYSMVAYLDPASTDAKLIEAIKQDYEKLKQAEAAAKEAQSAVNAKLKSPGGFSQALSESLDELLNRLHEQQLAKQKADQSLADKQALVKNTFGKGKSLLDQGDLAALSRLGIPLRLISEKKR